MKSLTDRLDRRSFLQGAAAIAAGSVAVASGGTLASLPVFAEDPPDNCPPPAMAGTPFVPGSDERPILLRKSISAFSPAELARLQAAFAALRGLQESDKRSWIQQADIHALNCGSCTNDATQIHFSWTFFPWHRAYLYYVERILGALIEDRSFRLPYWDWENLRTLPPAYTTPAGTGNSLWDMNRDVGLAAGGTLPPFDGSQARVAMLKGITDFATFGGSAASSGACEMDPHGPIHVDVGFDGGNDMGDFGFAARDPVFFAHHSNIDKIWSQWNHLSTGPGLPPGAYTNPTDAAFLNTRFSFYDETQQVVSISVADVLAHEANLRYTYTPAQRIPPFLVNIACRLICCLPLPPDPGPVIEVGEAARKLLLAHAGSDFPAVLALHGVVVPMDIHGTVDLVAVRGSKETELGNISFPAGGGMHHKMERGPATILLDITNALGDLLATSHPASIQAFQRLRNDDDDKGTETEEEKRKHRKRIHFPLKAESAEIRVQHL
jgi:polyphenol oxidase